MTPADSATLLIHLLDGFTGDDDENAGLEILRKNLAQLRMDDTLTELDKRNRFDQLLDDYHGSEYQSLLDLLSEHIERTPVKARYLDAFIAMWWVREHEERAIVVLLERTDIAPQTELLTQKERYRELRAAIDTESLSVRYEKILKGVNIQHGQNLSTKLQAIFTIEAKKMVSSGKRSQAEVDALLKDAADELAGELLTYATELEKALKKPKVSSSDIADLNKTFEKRLYELVELKSIEFGLELKYNVEFNRGLKENLGRLWRKEDLTEMDEILSKLPQEILELNPKFREFQREREHSDYAGQTSWSGETVRLAGNLTPGTTAHELGHVIDFSEPSLRPDFLKLSKWEALTAADIRRLVPDAKRAQKLIDRFDDNYTNDRDYEREKEGDYYYRHDRYGKGQYYRYHKDAVFITPYAQSDPYDDFAECFEYYVEHPKALQKKIPDKYMFMHARVFVDLWLKKQGERAAEEFDAEVKKIGKKIVHGLEFSKRITDKYVEPLRADMVKELTAQRTAKVAEAQGGKLPDPIPLKGSTAVQKTAAPYLSKLKVLLPLIEKVAGAYSTHRDHIFDIYLFLDPALENGFDILTDKMTSQFETELLALLEPVADLAIKGNKVDKSAWPEVDAIAVQMTNAEKVMEGYAKHFGELNTARTQFAQFTFRTMSQFKAQSKGWEDTRLFAVERLKKFLAEMDDIQKEIRAGVAFDPAKYLEPQKRLAQFEKEVTDFASKQPK